jgi:hypothetical protein
MPGVDALMVVVPADKPLTESCAELGHGGTGSLERYRVNSPLAGFRALPRLHCLKLE